MNTLIHDGFKATHRLAPPLFSAARQAPERVVYAVGEDERVLRAVQIALDERRVKPILVGLPASKDGGVWVPRMFERVGNEPERVVAALA